MKRVPWLVFLGFAVVVGFASEARSQSRPYIGFVYPAGGRQGATFQVRLGGQGMDDINSVLVSGTGVTARIVDYYWRMSNQEQSLISDQLKALKPAPPATPPATTAKRGADALVKQSPEAAAPAKAATEDPAKAALIAKIEQRISEYVPTPACASIAGLVFVEVTIAPDAAPGEREIRVVTLRGISNPLVFHVGQLPEYSRKPMRTATIQVLGKEAQALRKRPAGEIEDRIEIPSTLNGQIASGEVNRYRFTARKGRRLVISAQARRLVPYIADAVPGWFQPVLVLYDAAGKELAYDDDYRFQPDPAIFFQTPKDGEYLVAIYDSLYRGREDFVYRITIGELPFITSIFPLGGHVGTPAKIGMKGWNLQEAKLRLPAGDASLGVYQITANRKETVTNRVPFALDTLPECLEKERNNDPAHAQKIQLPILINGRINRPGDWDVFQFTGKANETIVAEVTARRLDSPLDSILKLTDAKGKVIAFNDDHEDPASGLNTHHADSYFMIKLPADGAYYVHLGDVARNGSEEFAYRLRVSEPRPDFALRVVPSSVSLRSNSSANVSVYIIRNDGFTGAVKLTLKDPPNGITASPVSLTGMKPSAQLTIKTSLVSTQEPFVLAVEGQAMLGEKAVVHEAVPAEDRMQAFLWRHLVPAQDLAALVFAPSAQSPPARIPPARPSPAADSAVTAGTGSANPAAAPAATKPKFTPQQVATRLRELKRLYGAGLLADDFYWTKVAECETPQ